MARLMTVPFIKLTRQFYPSRKPDFISLAKEIFNNHTGFLPTAGQDFSALFDYTPSTLTITHIEEYKYKQRRNTILYYLTWIRADKRQFTLKLRGKVYV